MTAPVPTPSVERLRQLPDNNGRRGPARTNYVGVRVGTFTGIEALGIGSSRNVVWLFRCDCGGERQWDTSNVAGKLRAHAAPRCVCSQPLRRRYARAADRAHELRPQGLTVDPRLEGGTREQVRSRRKHATRKRTVSMLRITKTELAVGRVLYPEQVEHPRTRGECAAGSRPCPLVGCKFHLYIDVTRTGSIAFNFPDLEVEEMAESCALDVADQGGTTLEDVGAIMNLTRERIRQVEVKALAKMARAGARMAALREYADEGPVGKRRLPVLQEGG